MTPQPWNQQPGESPAAYRAFLVYRDLGPKRSLSAALEADGRPPTSLAYWGRWSSANAWLARCAAWDAHLQKLADEANATEVTKMAKRHAQLAESLQGVVTLPLNELARRLQEGEVDMKEIPLPELLRMLRELGPVTKHAVDIERVSRGQPSDRLEVGSPAELQEVERLRELVRKHQAPPGPEPQAPPAAAADEADA